jgi:hypothetical protein
MNKYYHYLKYIININPKIKLTYFQINKNILDKIIGGRFISKNIQEEILNQDLYKYYSFEYNFNNINGSIYIGIYKNDNIDMYIKQLETVSKILIFLGLISKSKKSLKAYIFMSKFTKISNGYIFNPDNINSGYTTFAMLDRYIVVYRKEEYIKVLIHEAIHFFELDKYFNQFGLLNDYLPFKFKNDDIITEAFTDYFAINYYILFICIYLNKITLQDYHYFFNQQIEFIEKQAINIIQLSKVNETNIINNYTNVFSYYVLKYILFKYYYNKNLFKINKENFKKIIDKMYLFIKNVPNKNITQIPLNMTSHIY